MATAPLITAVHVSSIALATLSSVDQGIPSQLVSGLTVVFDVTVLTGTAPTLQLSIEGKDPISGKYYKLIVDPAALAAAGTQVIQIAPGIAAAAAGVTHVSGLLVPPLFRVRVTGAGTAITDASFTVSAAWV